jgi:hypothetical protein
MTAEEFDKQIASAVDVYISGIKALNNDWAAQVGKILEKGEASNIPKHFMESSLNLSIKKLKELEVEQ